MPAYNNDKAKSKSKANKSKSVRRLSNLVKPADMSLEEWQIKLRTQIAEKSEFNVEPMKGAGNPGYYLVNHPLYERVKLGDDRQENERRIIGYTSPHKVVYRGVDSEWNYCSCLDFKTSGLGTCKHIEAVKLWLKSKHRRPAIGLPPHSSLYVDYKGGRKIKVRLGQDHKTKMRALAKKYFDTNNELKSYTIESAIEFISEAKNIDSGFRWYPDVLDFLRELSRKNKMAAMGKAITEAEINSLLKTNLYPYQREGIRFAISHPRSIIADEMGLGKTIQAIGYAEFLRKNHLATSVLLVCPTSLKYQWKMEIEKFTDSKVLVIEGNMLKRKVMYADTEHYYKIVSYNAMCNDVKAHGALTTDVLIMDEVQRLKNWDTQAAQAARKIVSEYTLILSGTPLENKLEDLFSIVELVDQYFLAPYYKFRDECIVTDEAGMTVGYKNLNLVGERLKDILLRRRKLDVALQMPKRQDQTIYVEMTKPQADIHAEFAECVTRIVSKWRSMHFLSEQDRLRLLMLLGQMRMVANSTYILDQSSRNDTKVGEMLNILDNVFESGDEKVVIFSTWERMTRIIAAELENRGIRYANLNGSVPSIKRKQLIEDFNSDPQCRVFLSTDAGATGLNLQAASILINMELPWNPAVLEQRIGRIYRLGQQRNIQVVNFVSLGSIERQIEEKIRFKSDLFKGILDDGSDSIFLSDKSKFDELVETFESWEKSNEDEDEIPQPDIVDVEVEDVGEPHSDLGKSVDEGVPGPEDIVESNMANSISSDKDNCRLDPAHAADPNPVDASDLVKQGVSFLSGLAATLQSPDRTKALVETIVKTDPATGQAKLEIPIPDKSVVTGFLQMLGSLIK